MTIGSKKDGETNEDSMEFNNKLKYPAMPIFDLDDSSKMFKKQRMS